jgi:redox-sensitive bicupin YhaK (pirin superfamily)
MITIRPAAERGHFDYGWLDTYHTFSFGSYYDPAHMGFRSLRVINEDRVRGGTGFGKHPHRDMEIITFIVSGSLEHRDSMGHGAVLVPGDVQYMSAGTGVAHSEFNPSRTEDVHLLQIWIEPAQIGLSPRYEQRKFPVNESVVLASPDGREGSIVIRQDAVLSAATLPAGKELIVTAAAGRGIWVQMIDGEVAVDGQVLGAGDGAAVIEKPEVRMAARRDARLLVFDLA